MRGHDSGNTCGYAGESGYNGNSGSGSSADWQLALTRFGQATSWDTTEARAIV